MQSRIQDSEQFNCMIHGISEMSDLGFSVRFEKGPEGCDVQITPTDHCHLKSKSPRVRETRSLEEKGKEAARGGRRFQIVGVCQRGVAEPGNIIEHKSFCGDQESFSCIYSILATGAFLSQISPVQDQELRDSVASNLQIYHYHHRELHRHLDTALGSATQE